jgi:large subunit ribosomal protein L25
MKTFEFKAQKREKLGKSVSKSLRADGNIPCVLYGGEENVNFYVHENALKDIVYTPSVYLLKIDIDGKSYDAIMQDIQFHPVTDSVIHIDFIQVSDDKEIGIRIPVKLTGDSKGIKAGGKLRFIKRALRVKGLAKDLPDTLNIDITKVGIGDSIKVADLSFDNLKLMDSPRAMVVGVTASRLSKSGDEMLDEEEEEEGEEAEEKAAE